MAVKIHKGKLGYGLLFCVVLPALLILWADEVFIDLPLPPVWAGWMLSILGIALVLEGMRELWVFGGGLPMNAFPPPRFVARGVYKFIAHPIYFGFCCACGGVSILSSSASGLYLVTPVISLCCLALVYGYELPRLRSRFGKSYNRHVGLVERSLQAWCERLGNSWSAWEWRGFRVINHAIYSGLAGFAAVLILSQFTTDLIGIVVIIFSSLVGGAAWGQWIEGSPSMQRPFGYYGALLGGVLGMIILRVVSGTPVIYWLGVFAMATPLTQAIGRLRCLVQGCCHGRETAGSGIHYYNVHSRVAAIPALKGKLLYNTQGFSILWNISMAGVLFTMQYLGATSCLLAGVYFILAGAGRFIEEEYRGEPQTTVIGGLRLYQWISIASIIFGAVVTTLPGGQPIIFSFNFSLQVLVAAAFAGLIWAFGMSMDFPKSTKRFSRLTG